jgi:Tol biopolymer transport system component
VANRFILACSGVLIALAFATSAAPHLLGSHTGTLAFIRFDEQIAHSRLWLLPAGGGRAKLLKLPFVAVDGPTWSPDGKSLIVVGGRNQPDQPRVTEAADLYLVTVATGRVRRLTTDSAHESGATWAPTGTRFAFVRSPAAAPNRSSIVVSSVGGDRPRRLTFGNVDLEPSWNAAGTWIAFLRIDARRHTSGIWLVRPDGRGLHRILAGLTNVTDPVWAPTGNRLLVSDGQRLLLTAPNGSGRRVVTTLAADASGIRVDPEPAWSPDGSRIVFVEARAAGEGHADLWSTGVNGGRPVRLTRSTGLDLSPAWG